MDPIRDPDLWSTFNDLLAIGKMLSDQRNFMDFRTLKADFIQFTNQKRRCLIDSNVNTSIITPCVLDENPSTNCSPEVPSSQQLFPKEFLARKGSPFFNNEISCTSSSSINLGMGVNSAAKGSNCDGKYAEPSFSGKKARHNAENLAHGIEINKNKNLKTGTQQRRPSRSSVESEPSTEDEEDLSAGRFSPQLVTDIKTNKEGIHGKHKKRSKNTIRTSHVQKEAHSKNLVSNTEKRKVDGISLTTMTNKDDDFEPKSKGILKNKTNLIKEQKRPENENMMPDKSRTSSNQRENSTKRHEDMNSSIRSNCGKSLRDIRRKSYTPDKGFVKFDELPDAIKEQIYKSMQKKDRKSSKSSNKDNLNKTEESRKGKVQKKPTKTSTVREQRRPKTENIITDKSGPSSIERDNSTKRDKDMNSPIRKSLRNIRRKSYTPDKAYVKLDEMPAAIKEQIYKSMQKKDRKSSKSSNKDNLKKTQKNRKEKVQKKPTKTSTVRGKKLDHSNISYNGNGREELVNFVQEVLYDSDMEVDKRLRKNTRSGTNKENTPRKKGNKIDDQIPSTSKSQKDAFKPPEISDNRKIKKKKIFRRNTVSETAVKKPVQNIKPNFSLSLNSTRKRFLYSGDHFHQLNLPEY